ncbi:hypothetical protein B8W90_14255, partial [Staphylococcus hominis]
GGPGCRYPLRPDRPGCSGRVSVRTQRGAAGPALPRDLRGHRTGTEPLSVGRALAAGGVPAQPADRPGLCA